MIGKVLFFDKTYGFIRCEGIPRDLFFHYSDIDSESFYKVATPGDEVTFSIVETNDGKVRAANVKTLENIGGKHNIKVRVFWAGGGDVRCLTTALKDALTCGLSFHSGYNDYMVMSSEEINDIDIDEVIRIAKDENLVGLTFPIHSIYNSQNNDVIYRFI